MSNIHQNLAQNLAALRKARGLTQEQLQALSHVPRTTLSRIESGEGNPTLSVLNKISLSLGVTLEELMAPPSRSSHLFLKKDLKHQSRSQGQVMKIDMLPKPIPGLQFERIDCRPHALLVGVPHSKGTREYFSCTKGQFKVIVEGLEYLVNEGDVLAFPGDLKHSYHNTVKITSAGISLVILDTLDE